MYRNKPQSANSLWATSQNFVQRGSWVNSSKDPHRISWLPLGLTGSLQLPVLLLCPPNGSSSAPLISYSTSVLSLQMSPQYLHCSPELLIPFTPCCPAAFPRPCNASPRAALTSQFPAWFPTTSHDGEAFHKLLFFYYFVFFFLLKVSKGIRQALSNDLTQKEGRSVA